MQKRKPGQPHKGWKDSARAAKATSDIEKWCKEQGATESVTYDEETGQPLRTFTIDLTK